MRFASPHARLKYVVKQAVKVPGDGITAPHVRPGLRVVFDHGVFDSEVAQKNHGWTDSERERVEQFLLNHEDFQKPTAGNSTGRGIGKTVIYLADADGEAQATDPREAQVAGKFCLMVTPMPDGSSHLCGQETAGAEYCPKHLVDVEGAGDSPAVEAFGAPEPPEASGETDGFGIVVPVGSEA